MKMGIIGLPQTGKKTIFSLLTGSSVGEGDANKVVSGVAHIRDQRFDKLVDIYKPKKEAPARIDFELLPKIESNTIKDGAIFRDIADMDSLCHIVRAFTSESVYHVEGSVDAIRDIEEINSELILHDMLFIEKRIDRIALQQKKQKTKDNEIEQAIMERFLGHLEDEKHLRTIEVSDEEKKIVGGYPFITMKKMLIVLNVDDDKVGDESLIRITEERCKDNHISVMVVSAALEAEIALLESEEDREEFMTDSGITEPALNVLSRLAMDSLGLQSYFTVGTDEVKQWLVKKGSTAPEAAGVIHSDIQRGFIRAEVMKYDELLDFGSEEELKKAGKFYVMGKDYIVEDGDLISFRFNV